MKNEDHKKKPAQTHSAPQTHPASDPPHSAPQTHPASGDPHPASDPHTAPAPPHEKEIEKLKRELEEMTDLSRRALADLQNFKRRSEEEKTAFIKFANAAMIQEFLPSIDNIYRSLEHESRDLDWTKGVEHTLRQFIQSLEKAGIEVIETKGRLFDPNLHEALLVAPGEKDKIISELEKGYTFNGRVIKQAKVQVGNGESD